MTTPRRNTIDLHTHSTRSDGVLSPAELYDAMRSYGMRLVALTDHDTVDGYLELRDARLGDAATEQGPQLIAGVEINTLGGQDGIDWPGEFHILGFGMDVEDAGFERTLKRQRERRRERFQDSLRVLAQLGMPVDDVIDSIVPTDERASIGRPHLARALVEKGYATSVDDAFERVLQIGRAGYVPRFGISTREAIEAIAKARGLPVLAHFREALERPELVDRLISWGLRGIEVYYGGGRHGYEPSEVQAMAAFAQSRNVLATGGSDYHGLTMEEGRPVSYAHAQGLTYVPEDVGDSVLDALSRCAAVP